MTTITVGIDEVGRGCWAGPLVAAAVIISNPSSEIDDSKVLSKKKREKLSRIIFEVAEAVGIGWATVDEINDVGLSRAVSLAMGRALNLINIPFEKVIIDGNYNYLPSQEGVVVLPKADAIIPSVGAASIVAKVFRDKWMKDLSRYYQGYGFENNAGYGTAQHISALKNLGVSKMHRLNYKPIKLLLKQQL